MCYQQKRPSRIRFTLAAAVIGLAAGSLVALSLGGPARSAPSRPAHAAVDHKVVLTSAAVPRRLVALRWAKTQAGCWYEWAGAGPCSHGYDCSGLAMAAYAHAGISLPHNTVAMLDSGKLIWVPRSQARWGDLVMWGGSDPYHVELFNGYNGELTFGAEHSGTRVGYHWQGGSVYAGEAIYRVAGAG